MYPIRSVQRCFDVMFKLLQNLILLNKSYNKINKLKLSHIWQVVGNLLSSSYQTCELNYFL